MKAYLTDRISNLRARLGDIERERLTLAGELRAYEDALQHFVAEELGSSAPQPAQVPGPTEQVEPTSKTKSSTSFEMSPDWLNVMRSLMWQGKPFSAADMMATAEKNGFETKTTNARSQLSFYEKKGYVRRVGRGQYLVTPEGRLTFSKKSGPNSQTQNAQGQANDDLLSHNSGGSALNENEPSEDHSKDGSEPGDVFA